MTHGTGIPVLPDGEPQLAHWRVALVAYRAAAQAGQIHYECEHAGSAALLAAFPEMTERQARQELTDAIGWVTRSEYAKWFYAGRPQREWVWPPRNGAVGLYRPPGSKIP